MSAYAYGLSIGALFVYHQVKNGDVIYNAGDVISIFFGVLFGAFAMGMGAPNIKAVSEGLVNCAAALLIINRVPKIQLDDPESENFHIEQAGDIVFENVSFKYPGREESALDGVSFVCKKGETTALVGASGSGKSTTVKLLERYYDPSSGKIMIGSQQLNKIHLRQYRQSLGYVGQEPVLFNQTIKENILYCKPDATDEEIFDALRMANASKIVEKLQEGINTNVGSSGG